MKKRISGAGFDIFLAQGSVGGFFVCFITHLCPFLVSVSLLLIFPGSSLKSSQQLSSAPDFQNGSNL